MLQRGPVRPMLRAVVLSKARILSVIADRASERDRIARHSFLGLAGS
jgi:hypothetical protein